MDNRETVLRDLFARLNARQFEIGDLLTDEAEFDVPYANFPERIVGRIAFEHMFSGVTAKLFKKLDFTLLAFHHSEDGVTTVAEYTSQGVIAANGKPYANRYAGIFRFRDGKIALWREYFNPEEFARATSA